MGPLEIQAAMGALKTAIGGEDVDVFCNVSLPGRRHDEPPLSLSAYPNGLTRGQLFRVQATEWDDLFARANQKWAERKEELERNAIRDMALAIIRITSEFGSCSDAALRGEKWTSHDVGRFGERACAAANEMAGKGPFVILAAEKANAA